jgi:CrcB protein
MDFLLVGIGGFLGANARFFISGWIAERIGATLPWNTFIINLTGSFVIGFLLTAFTERFLLEPAWRLFLVVGFLGGYTTFSSYAWEGFRLLEDGAWQWAAAYLLGSTGLGLLATILGVVAARSLAR